jgi:hypothetical protein
VTETRFQQRGRLPAEVYERAKHGWDSFLDLIAERLVALRPHSLNVSSPPMSGLEAGDSSGITARRGALGNEAAEAPATAGE